MTTVSRIVLPSGAFARSRFQPLLRWIILRNFETWQKHDAVKHSGIDRDAAGAHARCVVARG